jgi:hypothetical protein
MGTVGMSWVLYKVLSEVSLWSSRFGLLNVSLVFGMMMGLGTAWVRVG